MDPKRIRALDRGLAVIEHLSREGQSTLGDLRGVTGLSNATLLRILATLQDRNWVRRALVEGKYQLSHSVGTILRSNVRAHPVAELAAPIMAAMTREDTQWPSDLVVPIAAGVIEVVESTRARGPMAPLRTAYGVRPSMALSAHGRALLAFTSAPEAAAHKAALALSGSREDRHWVSSGKLDKAVTRARRDGFGTREANYWAEPFDFGPELGAVAHPITVDGQVFATLSMLWPLAALTHKEFRARSHLDTLALAADRISRAVAHAGIAPPRYAPQPATQAK